MMFSDLAAALPDCTWQMLFDALGRLSRQHRVELTPHRWDYEVVFLNGPDSPYRADDRCGHGERIY